MIRIVSDNQESVIRIIACYKEAFQFPAGKLSFYKSRKTKNEEVKMIFEGFFRNGDAIVLKDGEPLSPEKSQKIMNHSPDGFNWGYNGSGPAQLALALLLEITTEERALALYQQFKQDVVAYLPTAEKWLLTGEDINNWLKKQL